MATEGRSEGQKVEERATDGERERRERVRDSSTICNVY